VPVVRAGAPHEVAHAALDRLEASTLLERGEVKAFHIEVSLIVRAYIEARFGIDALEMTTREVMVELGAGPADPAALGDCGRFLVACDLVKFAKRRPADAESRALIQVARVFVDATTPEPPVEEQSVVGDAREGDEEEAA
jgi:hypothetical protein